MKKVGVGVIGCGVISGAYLKAAKGFPILDIRGLADMVPAAAEARAKEFGLKAASVDALLADPTIEIVLNLTVPKAHVEVGLKALDAGKHVYSEKPLGVAFKDGKKLVDRAAKKKLRVGSAPDTFLGGAHQTCRKLIDAGKIGTPVGGTAYFMCPGHERWHPAPDFYYQVGGGPILDMAPYYLTDLINLLGPVARVAAMTSMPKTTRTITSKPRYGQSIPVEIATHAAGTLQFVSGALVQVSMSFDVPAHRHLPIEIYGIEGHARRARPELVRRRHRVRGGEGQMGEAQDRASLCRRQLPFDRACRHGACDPLQAPAPGERRTRAARARSDGGVRALVGERQGGRDRDAA